MAATRRWTLFIAGFVLIAVGFQAVWPWMIGIDAIPAGSVAQAVHPAQAAIGLLAVEEFSVPEAERPALASTARTRASSSEKSNGLVM